MQFCAILRDSFREAMDGFVIYVMLVLSLLFLGLIASLSFEPAPASRVIPDVLLQRFVLFLPESGASQIIGTIPGVRYEPSAIETEGSHVRFRLKVQGTPGRNGEADAFRKATAAWKKPPGKTVKLSAPSTTSRPKLGDKPLSEFELAEPIAVTTEEAAAVTPPMMTAFLENQFAVHFGINGAQVTPVDQTTPAGEYLFDVHLPRATASRGWPQSLGLFFGGVEVGEVGLGQTIYILEDQIVNGIGAGISLMIAVVITAFFIPNLVRKGSLDLIIAKPIGRVRLLLYKYLGGLTFIFLLSAVNFGGTWVILGLRSGHWDPRFLLAIPMLTFTFALLYAVSTLVAVFTRSAIAAIILTLGFAFVLYLIGQAKSLADQMRAMPEAPFHWPDSAYTISDTGNTILPRYKDLDKLMSLVTAEGTLTPIEMRFMTVTKEFPSWGEAVGLSLAYIAVMLACACWRFRNRDG
ncbi:MAG: ABC transporter permease [Bacteroidales bacterium]|nr:ABC transporter permease [Bacteroidales bacterium]